MKPRYTGERIPRLLREQCVAALRTPEGLLKIQRRLGVHHAALAAIARCEGIEREKPYGPRRESTSAKIEAARASYLARTPREERSHVAAWRLRSPTNELYCFRNLAAFIEHHVSLFSESDLRQRDYGQGPKWPMDTRAYSGLSKLSPRRKQGHSTWKEWTWA